MKPEEKRKLDFIYDMEMAELWGTAIGLILGVVLIIALAL